MTFRYARHTNKLNELKTFYTSILAMEVLGGFINHSGYDGVFLGKKNADWHLEFTQTVEKAIHEFDEDDHLVFYPSSIEEFDSILKNLNLASVPVIQAQNPYWQNNGICFCDPDGYRIILVKKK